MDREVRHLVLKFGVNRVEIDTLKPMPYAGSRQDTIARALREAYPPEEPFFMGRKRAFFFFGYEGAEYALENVKNLMDRLISSIERISVPIEPKAYYRVNGLFIENSYEYGRNLYRYAQFVAEAAEFLLGGGD